MAHSLLLPAQGMPWPQYWSLEPSPAAVPYRCLRGFSASANQQLGDRRLETMNIHFQISAIVGCFSGYPQRWVPALQASCLLPAPYIVSPVLAFPSWRISSKTHLLIRNYLSPNVCLRTATQHVVFLNTPKHPLLLQRPRHSISPPRW